MERVMWLVLGATVMVASPPAHRSDRARLVARVALGVLFLVFGALVVGEATAGILVLSGGRRLETGLLLLPAFHVGLLFFGWRLWLVAVPMLGALTLLLRAERRHGHHSAPPRHGAHRGSTRADTDRAVGGGVGGAIRSELMPCRTWVGLKWEVCPCDRVGMESN